MHFWPQCVVPQHRHAASAMEACELRGETYVAWGSSVSKVYCSAAEYDEPTDRCDAHRDRSRGVASPLPASITGFALVAFRRLKFVGVSRLSLFGADDDACMDLASMLCVSGVGGSRCTRTTTHTRQHMKCCVGGCVRGSR